jgi:apolipoprotein N-acyltransferase
MYAAASIVLGFITLIPYLLDRSLATRLGAFASTLVLPSATVAIEMLQSLGSPFGSWGSFAYSQGGNLPLLQLLSITGLAGVTFLVLWFAAVINSRRPRIILAYSAILCIVMLCGALRLQSTPATETVRVAAITPRIPTYTVRGDAANAAVHDALRSVRTQHPISNAQWDAFRRRAANINDELLATTEREARFGARLVVWSEGAGILEQADEPAFIARAAELARRARVWIEASYLVLDRRGSATFENKNVLVDDAGRVVWTYDKSHPVPGMETCTPGDGRVPAAPTPFGRVATVICYDADFPRLVQQAGRAEADLLLIPADDWREIARFHSTMASFRAIEQGVSIVRATSSGYSTVVDAYGRTRMSRDYFSGARTMNADVPRVRVPTLYARIGDVTAWMIVALLIVLLTMATRARAAGDRALPSRAPVRPVETRHHRSSRPHATP